MSLTKSTQSLPSAFGYTPESLPDPILHRRSSTPKQAAKLEELCAECSIPMAELPYVRAAVLQAYGLPDAGSAYEASLLVDFLLNADDDALEAARVAPRAVESPCGSARLPPAYDPSE